MADLISRLRLESGEFDSKIKRAGQELMAYSEHCKETGSTMGEANKDAKDFAKALGSMQTTSSSARGKVNELTEAFVNLKVMYKNMTDEEKNNTFGKNLAASLDQLKTRIDQAKTELNDVNAELGNTKQAEVDTKGGLEGLTSALGINVKSLVGWGSALTAGKVALDVAKDAFFQSESNIDDWGRAVQASEAAYNVFLQTLTTGNWSGFFDNLSTAINGARDLYDALDRLGSIKSNNQAAIAIVQQQIAQLRLAKQQGQNVDAQLKEATKTLANLQNQSVSAGKNAGRMMAAETIKNRFNAQGGNLAGSTANAAVERIMKNGQAEFDRQAKIKADLEKAGTGTRDYGTYKVQGVFDINNLTKEQQKQYKLAKAITEGETEIQKGIATYAQAVSEGTANAREEFKGNRYALQGAGKGGKDAKTTKKDIKYADDSIMAQEKLISDLTQKWKTAAGAVRNDYAAQLDAAKAKLKEMTAADKLPTFTMAELESTSPQSIDLRGNNGKAQDKLDLATANFATSGTNNVNFSSYTSALQNAINDANIGSELYAQLSEQLSDSSQVSQLLQQYVANGIIGADLAETAQELKDKLMSGEINDDTMQQYVDELNAKLKEKFDESEWPNVLITFDADTNKIVNAAQQQQKEAQKMAKDWQTAGSAIQAVGAAMSQIENPAAKVMGTIAQAVASIALGASQAIAQAGNGSAGGPWGWIAFAAAATATMISTIASVHNATGFANGGIYDGGGFVPGNKYSGDLIPANGGTVSLSSGELILNRAQQGVIAQELEGGGLGNMQLETHVDAEELIIMLNNNGLRRGRGRYIDG